MSLSRDDIVREAIALLSADGLDALSLRKLAARLKISAPTLYWHVAGKRELLDLMAEELTRAQRESMSGAPTPGQPWWRWLRARSQEMFEALVAVRDAPRVIAGNRPTAESLHQIDVTLGVLADAGIPAAEAQQALFSIGSYVVGSAIEWQAEAERDGVETRGDAQLEEALRRGDFPNVAAALSGIAEQPPHATFEYGLDLLVDALRARYGEATGVGES